jgi:hypothetical protein
MADIRACNAIALTQATEKYWMAFELQLRRRSSGMSWSGIAKPCIAIWDCCAAEACVSAAVLGRIILIPLLNNRITNSSSKQDTVVTLGMTPCKNTNCESRRSRRSDTW